MGQVFYNNANDISPLTKGLGGLALDGCEGGSLHSQANPHKPNTHETDYVIYRPACHAPKRPRRARGGGGASRQAAIEAQLPISHTAVTLQPLSRSSTVQGLHP